MLVTMYYALLSSQFTEKNIFNVTLNQIMFLKNELSTNSNSLLRSARSTYFENNSMDKNIVQN